MNWAAIKNLRTNLLAITSQSYTRQQVNAVVRVCHSFSIACIQSQSISRVLNNTHGLSVSDLALDCIAELFQQNENYEFVQLSTFFESISLESCSDEEALVHLRRLVFSKTYNGLFRLYNEADPTLGKILRNIKIAVQSLGHFTECLLVGEPAIAPTACDPLAHLPPPDRETLQCFLSPHILGNETIPIMLARLSRYLRRQRLHSRVIPLMDVAVVFRALYARPAQLPSSTVDHSSDLLRLDVETVIQAVHRRSRGSAEETYVGTGKLKRELLDIYFRVIDAGLRAKYVELDGSDFSLFKALKSEMPRLTAEEFRHHHRSKLEYLSREVHKEVRKTLKNS